MRRRHRLMSVAVGIALSLVGCDRGGPEVLHDFRGATIPDAIKPVGGATLSQSSGRLFVKTSAPGGGVRVEVAPRYQCVAFEDVLLADSKPGDTLTLKWIVRDDAGNTFTLLESVWTHVQSTQYATTKRDRNGNPVQVVVTISDKTVNDFRPFRVAFDRRVVNGREEVQLEFRDPSTNQIKKLFPWADPSPTSTVAFEITTTLPSFSIGAVAGNTEHDLTQFKEFPPEEFRQERQR